MATTKCPECGKTVGISHSFCPHCGASADNIRKAAAGLETLVALGEVVHEGGRMSISKRKIADEQDEYSTLEKACRTAVCTAEEVVLDDSLRSMPLSDEHAPFAMKNMAKWERAAKLGLLDGMYLLGCNLLEGSATRDEGVVWLEKANRGGHRPAKRELGEALTHTRDSARGIKYLKEAAEEADPWAGWQLAVCYEEGNGVSRSRRQYWR